ncbi:Rpn family recombination-promoting nuclease/putative transposase [Desulfosporosinus shakirovi]
MSKTIFQLTETLEMNFMELPKLVSKWRRREVNPWENGLVRWLLLLEGSENQEILKTLEEIAMQDPVLHQAIAEWEKSSDGEAELRLREAIQKGIEGRAEGKAEVAKNLLDWGMDISKIAKATGMTEDEVKVLKD